MKKTLSIILSVLLILFFVGCTKPTQSSQAPQEALNPQEVAQQTVFAVNAFLSYKGDLNGYLEFGGDVSAVSRRVHRPCRTVPHSSLPYRYPLWLAHRHPCWS